MSGSATGTAYGVRVMLPHHLQTLARCPPEVRVDVREPVTQRTVLDALEARYPMLRGTIRDHASGQRRPRVRFFANATDVTHDAPDRALPDVIATGAEPFMIVGAISGG